VAFDIHESRDLVAHRPQRGGMLGGMQREMDRVEQDRGKCGWVGIRLVCVGGRGFGGSFVVMSALSLR
jgi:hypothetical protein